LLSNLRVLRVLRANTPFGSLAAGLTYDFRQSRLRELNLWRV
jgi:hypothetical protein